MATDVVTRGVSFGFEVRSELAFAYLRGGAGEPLDVNERLSPGPPADDEEPVLRWTPPVAPLDARLYGDDDKYRLWIEGSGWFEVNPARGVVTVPAAEDRVRREERLWGIPSALCFAARGDVPLHAAAIEVGTGAVVVAAPGRFGKTTLAAAFAEDGHRVLSEDLTCLRLGPVPAVVPGPAMLRLRRDVAHRFDMSWGTVVAERDDRVHVALASGRRGTCAPVPVSALVVLRWSNRPLHLERRSSLDALADLWGLSFHLPNSIGRTRCFNGLTALVDQVPVFDLWRRPTFDDMRAAVDVITGLCGSTSPHMKELTA